MAPIGMLAAWLGFEAHFNSLKSGMNILCLIHFDMVSEFDDQGLFGLTYLSLYSSIITCESDTSLSKYISHVHKLLLVYFHKHSLSK